MFTKSYWNRDGVEKLPGRWKMVSLYAVQECSAGGIWSSIYITIVHGV